MIKSKIGMKNFTNEELESNRQNYGDDQLEKYVHLMQVDVNEPGSGWHKSMDIKTQGYEGTLYWKKVEGLNVNLVRIDVVFKGINV